MRDTIPIIDLCQSRDPVERAAHIEACRYYQARDQLGYAATFPQVVAYFRRLHEAEREMADSADCDTEPVRNGFSSLFVAAMLAVGFFVLITVLLKH